MTPELVLFRENARRFLEKEFVPQLDRWLDQGCVDREAWVLAGRTGLLCPGIPAEYGGGGGDFRHEAVFIEELEYSGIGFNFGFVVHSTIAAEYVLAFGSEDVKRRILPALASGTMVAAIAMTEPGTGSDLQAVRTTARREGDQFVLNGQKTFISNGQLADLIIVVAKTDPALGAKGMSLILVETAGLAGFRRGRNLSKIGAHAQDTSELFFDEVRVPVANLLGELPGAGFGQLMTQLPRERLALSVAAVASMERAMELTVAYANSRKAFGQTLNSFQNPAFTLAERSTEARIGRVFVDHCIAQHLAGELDTVTASMAKWWTTDKQFETADTCLQLHGGYGYMSDYPISRIFTDSRLQRIYGGTNEIMKLVISRSLRS